MSFENVANFNGVTGDDIAVVSDSTALWRT